MSYQAKDDKVLAVALKVQELCLKLSDSSVMTQVVAGDAITVTIDIGEELEEVRLVSLVQKAPDLYGIRHDFLTNVPGWVTVSGSTITLNLGAAPGYNLASPLGEDDCVIVKYIVKE
jgi:hypothetical protein